MESVYAHRIGPNRRWRGLREYQRLTGNAFHAARRPRRRIFRHVIIRMVASQRA
jgi:hypothetical protein